VYSKHQGGTCLNNRRQQNAKIIDASVARKSESTLYSGLTNTLECYTNCQSKYNGSAALKSAGSRTLLYVTSCNVSVSDFEAQNILDGLLQNIETRRQGGVENVHPVSTSVLDVYYFHVPSTLTIKKPPLQNFHYVSKGVAVQDKKAYGGE